MGTLNHNAIIVTTWDNADPFSRWLQQNLSADERQFVHRFPAVINGYVTFVVAPDGSKEGWDESNAGDDLRQKIIDHLESYEYGWDWIEVGFGEYGQKVLRGNCKNCYNDKEYAVNTK